MSALPIPPCKRHKAPKGVPCIWLHFAAGSGYFCDERIRAMLVKLEARLRRK